MLRLVVRYRYEALVFPLPASEVTLGSSTIHQPPGPPRPRSNGTPRSKPSVDDAR